jgi:hypothetical protein
MNEGIFWSKVRRHPTDCWEWLGFVCKTTGYGQCSKGFEYQGVHRIAYALAYGTLPPNMQVCHTCDNRTCVRPSHLWLGSIRDNMLDKNAKGRQAWGESNAGHKLTSKQVEEIKLRCKKHGDKRALAREYNVSESAVGRIINGKTWNDPSWAKGVGKYK